jgi:excisionase family DNA binding protein
METVIKRTSPKEQKIATKSVSDLNRTAAQISRKKSDVVKIKIQENSEFVTVPRKALDLLFYILLNMAEGKSISLIPSDSEVSTQQAADMLSVSRPHIVKLLEQGVIPFKKVGSHRRILLEDLIEYDEKLKAQRNDSLKYLAKQAQELRLGYE